MSARASRTLSRPGLGPRQGFTLLELLLVMFLVALVMGAGLGMFSSLDLGREQAVGLVKNALRTAENTAVASQAPARVRIDRGAGRLRAESLRVVGTWRFEGHSMAGGNGVDGAADSELFTHDGYIGDALSFIGERDSVARIDVQSDPAFDFREGFQLECVLRLEGVGGGRVLSIADHVRLEVGQGGALRASFRVRAEGPAGVSAAPGVPGRARAGGVVVVQSNPGMLVPDRWTRVRVSYDRAELVLFVDGVRVAAVPQTAPVWDIDGPLVLSDERLPFPGSLDDLVISTVAGDDEVVLPEGVQLVSAPAVIRFRPGGGLDPREHPDPVELVLGFDDGTRSTLTVGAYGTVE